MVSLNAPTGRGYRPIQLSIQLSNEGNAPSLAQLQFMTGRAENSPLYTREVMLRGVPRTIRYTWPIYDVWCAEGEYSQNLIEIDHICLSNVEGSIYYTLSVTLELSAPTYNNACPTVDGQ